MQMQPVIQVLERNAPGFHPVVPFSPASDQLLPLDLSESNTEITEDIFNDAQQFTRYLEEKLLAARCRYAIGGYAELRAMYQRSSLFSPAVGEPRRFHLGTDIWGSAGTPVHAFAGGMIHSFAFNNNFGDYGPTIILLHQFDGVPFYTLYGHLALRDLELIQAGKYISRGQIIGHFGTTAENGNWPPHLHIQIIIDLELKKGDYPGVCRYSEREKYLANCPDPDLVLQMNRYLKRP